MWFKRLFAGKTSSHPLYFYNTLGKTKQQFALPAYARSVRMYNCGPTVYGRQHVGNLSAAVFADTLRRVLEWNGYSVKQVINITDFGHLTSDADEGEDKMAKGLKQEGKALTMENMRDLATKYMNLYLEDIERLNVERAKITFPRASEYVPAMIAMVKTLEEKAYAYKIKDGVYFDTARFPAYAALGDIKLERQKEGARVAVNREKHSATDFALWKLNPDLGWDSPWGRGFPGWHLECSTMIHSLLGKQIDIHTGGIEHIAIHHNNEIAQSEAATGKSPFVRFWMHRAHIQIDSEKIAKSVGNVVYLSDVIEKGFHPLALRYLFLGAHYRTPANFTWQALEAAQTSFLKLRRLVDSEDKLGEIPLSWSSKIRERLNDDLDTPGALGALWEMLKDRKLSRGSAKAAILEADRVLGLGLEKPNALADELCKKTFGEFTPLPEVPERVRTIVEAREAARTEKNWEHADNLRNDLQRMGYTIEDTSEGPRLFRKQ